MKKPHEVIQPRWGVHALRKRAERIGSVLARDQQQAIERAVKEYDIAEARALVPERAARSLIVRC